MIAPSLATQNYIGMTSRPSEGRFGCIDSAGCQRRASSKNISGGPVIKPPEYEVLITASKLEIAWTVSSPLVNFLWALNPGIERFFVNLLDIWQGRKFDLRLLYV
jgi:hypothetical protein